MSACPATERLESYALGRDACPELAAHVRQCDSCSSQLSRIRSDNALLREFARARRGSSATPAGGRETQADALAEVAGYELLERIGCGGQGEVYRALQHATKRTVALKILRGGLGAAGRRGERFQREVELIAAFRHPNVVTVFDSGVTSDGRKFYAMEFVDGSPLGQWRAGGVATGELRDAVRLLAVLCGAVQYAHQRGVIHRDLKPGNVLIDQDGAPRVLDFGLAKLVEPFGESPRTQTGEFLGTLAYAAPEQVRGDPNAVDVRTDVHALGLIAYELLAGRKPYPAGGSLSDLVRNICETQPERPSRHNRALNDELDAIILRALAKEPERRYQSAGEMARDLERYLSGVPVDARGDSRWYMLRKTLRRYRVPLSVAAVFMLLLGAFAARASWDALRIARQRDEALAAQIGEARQRGVAEAVNNFMNEFVGAANPGQHARGDLRVRDVLESAAKALDQGKCRDQPEVEAALRITIGETYRVLAAFAEAEQHMRKALQIRRDLAARDATSTGDLVHVLQELSGVLQAMGRLDEAAAAYAEKLALQGEPRGPDALRIRAEDLNNLAGLRYGAGDLPGAIDYLRQALAIRRRLHTVPDLSLAHAMFNLGGVLNVAAQRAEAEPLIREALEIRRRLSPGGSRELAQNLVVLGDMCRHRGELDEAENLYDEALQMRERMFGRQHPDYAQSLTVLAGLARDRRQYDRCEALDREVVEINRRVYGDDHAMVAAAMYDLAVVLTDVGRVEESEPLHRAALDIRRRRLGESHPDVAASLGGLASALYVLERYDESIRLNEEALAIRREKLGLDHNLVGLTLFNMLASLSSIGDHEAAERTALELLDHWERVHGPDSAFMRQAQGKLAQVWVAQGRCDEAEHLLLTLLDAHERIDGPAHQVTLNVRRDLVRLYARRGDRARAESACCELIELIRTQADNPRLLRDVLVDYGRLLTGLKRYDEAETALLAAAEMQVAPGPFAEPRIDHCAASLAELYEATHAPERATAWRAKVNRRASADRDAQAE